MSESKFDIIELSNNAKGVIYKIHIESDSVWDFFCAFSENKFWIRELKENKKENNSNPVTKGIEVEDFVFRIDLEPISNIESHIRMLSMKNNDKIINFDLASLIYSSKNHKLKYVYLLENFMPYDYPFLKNDLMLFILDKIIDSSFDDTALAANCRILLEKFSKCMLGKYLLLRMIFYKYATYYFLIEDKRENRTGIQLWQKSPVVKSWFFEFYELLLKNDIEKYYPPEQISFNKTSWFIPPENDIIQFLYFTNKANFRFTD